MIHLTIDDHPIEVPRDYTVLQAARERGIHIPTLCYLESLAPYAACRVMDASDRQRINGCAESYPFIRCPFVAVIVEGKSCRA